MHAIRRSAPFAVLLGASLYLFSLTWQLEFPRAPGRLGPDVWPQIVLALLIATCLLGIARSLLLAGREGTTQAPPPTQSDETEDAEGPSKYGLVAAGALLLLAYPLALEHLGFLVATFLLMSLFMLVGQWRNLPAALVVSTFGTLALFYIFRGVVYVSLPLGAGPFRIFTLWAASLLGMR
jgi:putative tricarboxylic transport membrane protein